MTRTLTLTLCLVASALAGCDETPERLGTPDITVAGELAPGERHRLMIGLARALGEIPDDADSLPYETMCVPADVTDLSAGYDCALYEVGDEDRYAFAVARFTDFARASR